jgi:signal peptidase I
VGKVTEQVKSKNKKGVIREWAESILVAVLLALIVRTFVVEAKKIPTGSMEPTLHGDTRNGDRVLVNKFIYRFREPQRGEIVVFRSYITPGKKNYIKRLIGKPGEAVEIMDGRISINGVVVQDPAISEIYYYNSNPGIMYGKEGQKTEVPEDCYFVLGDNSKSSYDSRYWGFVKKKDMIGRAFVIYWPPARIKILK